MDRIIEELLTVKSNRENSFVLELYGDIREKVCQYIERWFEQKLEEELQEWLGRAPYQRRQQCGSRRLSVVCQKCGSRYRCDFFRNGRRRRRLLTMYGVVEIWLPRVKCKCGGSVSIPFRVQTQRFEPIIVNAKIELSRRVLESKGFRLKTSN